MRREARTLFVISSILVGVVVAGCSDETSSGTQSGGNGQGAGSSGTNTGTSAGGNSGSTGTNAGGASTGTNAGGAGTSVGGAGVGGGGVQVISECQGHVYECGDLMDNDNDGKIDSFDPDCLGPCDNTEGSYFGGIPGQSGPKCAVDCYFDQDSGAGNDDCYWDHRCDPNEVSPGYYPEPEAGAMCAYDASYSIKNNYACADAQAMQSDTCGDICGPLTPNGCDCFGCCVLPNANTPVWLGSEGANGNTVCTIAEVNNPAVCHPCVQVAACNNPCDLCEICIGKPEPDPSCNPTSSSSATTGTGSTSGTGSTTGSTSTGGGGGTQCPDGIQACGLPGQALCPANAYCVTGCCQIIPG